MRRTKIIFKILQTKSYQRLKRNIKIHKSLFKCRFFIVFPLSDSAFSHLIRFMFQDTTSFCTIQSLKVLTQDERANPKHACVDTLDVRVSILDLDCTPSPSLSSPRVSPLFLSRSNSFVRRAMTRRPYRPLENDLSSSRRLDLLLLLADNSP